jgi:outer membrane protein assembly factor BamE (lipoprotein component of BamABCDE complex)
MKDLDNDMKELLRNISLCCVKINEQKNLNCTFKKLDFLDKEAFYDNFPNTKFDNNATYV